MQGVLTPCIFACFGRFDEKNLNRTNEGLYFVKFINY